MALFGGVGSDGDGERVRMRDSNRVRERASAGERASGHCAAARKPFGKFGTVERVCFRIFDAFVYRTHEIRAFV